MIATPQWLREHIHVSYPPNNNLIFEEWLYQFNYLSEYEADKYCPDRRHYLPIFWTSIWVNHNYGNDLGFKQRVQDYVDSLDPNKKYWTVVQYDDSVLIDFKGKDVLIFDMSKNDGNRYPIPLLCQPHPYRFSGEKKYLANFIGSHTHPIRDKIFALEGTEGFYISDKPHDIETYCRIISESYFTLAPRGYGLASFRCAEAMQYNSIPVYISDKFIEPYNINFNAYGIKINAEELEGLDLKLVIECIRDFPMQADLNKNYNELFTYEGCRAKILEHLSSGV
jgi:hypothetical protein